MMTGHGIWMLYLWGIALTFVVLVLAILLDGGRELETPALHVAVACIIISLAWPIILTALLFFIAFGTIVWLVDDE